MAARSQCHVQVKGPINSLSGVDSSRFSLCKHLLIDVKQSVTAATMYYMLNCKCNERHNVCVCVCAAFRYTGSILGLAVGCIAGMVPLLFMELKPSSGEQRMTQKVKELERQLAEAEAKGGNMPSPA